MVVLENKGDLKNYSKFDFWVLEDNEDLRKIFKSNF